MHHASLPLSRDLLLLGGGHTHALVLHRWAAKPLPGVRVTLVNAGATAPYSGMLPGHVAGHYRRDELEIDLVSLARRAGARLVTDPAIGIDPATRTVRFAERPDIAFDVASIDVGITSAMPALDGFADHGVPAKPLGPFADAWARFRSDPPVPSVAVIGGGVAGAELAMAMAHALRRDGHQPTVTLIDRGTVAGALRPKTARRLRAALADQGVAIRENATPSRVTPEGVVLADGSVVQARFVTGAAGARPHRWLADTPLADADGFVPVDSCLRSRDRAIYAVGDCARMIDSPRPKAGVYAVRQAPVLFHNLQARLAGTGGERPYRPQRDYLKLISLGERAALADRYGVTVAAPALWRWKDRIDRRFMEQFDPPAAPPEPLPWPRAKGAREAAGAKPLCGGCGAKVGHGTLEAVLPDSGEDAAILATGGVRQVVSTDHLRAIVEDPVTMARIAAVHALGDIWAMGARPQAATASVVLPRQSQALAERALRETMQAAAAIFERSGARIVGGHSAQGAEASIGFTVTGLLEAAPILQSGGRPGDRLILTRPLGTGLIFAAEMQRKARADWVTGALAAMVEPQDVAADILRKGGARAMTDVTGFGLAGHLRRICLASGVGARVVLNSVPLLPGAAEIAAIGIRSSLDRENREAVPGLGPDPALAPLTDPQTCGGLLAAVGDGAEACLDALRAAGHDAAIIGTLTDGPPQIDVV